MSEYSQDFLNKISGNGIEVLIAAAAANVLAQLIKTVAVGIQKRKFNLAIFFATGGMPSSHSSTVVALAASVGLIDGFSSITFAVAACVAAIVMYDAAGLRRAASRQAVLLNQIVQNLFQNNPELNRGKLKEFLGHTPTEVFAGAGLGVAVSIGIRYLLNGYGAS
ncbi:MAG TPA: divergent PAP2 family protein [Chitinophagales bacterium]|nr:divergent PAP2 family protein [Chitinophagales bacterium]